MTIIIIRKILRVVESHAGNFYLFYLVLILAPLFCTIPHLLLSFLLPLLHAPSSQDFFETGKPSKIPLFSFLHYPGNRLLAEMSSSNTDSPLPMLPTAPPARPPLERTAKAVGWFLFVHSLVVLVLSITHLAPERAEGEHAKVVFCCFPTRYFCFAKGCNTTSK